MTRHFFLTGEKQVGKSTLLQKILNDWPGTAGGFRTVRTNAWLGSQYSVHLFGIGEPAVPNRENLLFVCGRPDPQMEERFDRLGGSALERSAGCSLLVMDELGPHEAAAAAFRQAVSLRLDGEIPILGVLQAPAEAFWPEVTAHPAVRVGEVTRENRDQAELAEGIRQALWGGRR